MQQNNIAYLPHLKLCEYKSSGRKRT